VGYPTLRDFIVYRDPATLLSPSTQPLATTRVCKYDDTIANAVNGAFTALAYRVAVRARDLTIGQTYTDVQVTIVPPLVVNDTILGSTITLGTPFTLSANVSGYSGPRVSYAWDIGNKGVFVAGTKPETTFVVHDTITDNYLCVLKVLVDNKVFSMDTARLSTHYGWQQVASQFVDSGSTGAISTVLLGGNIVAFASSMTAGNPKRVWQSVNAQQWTKVTDSLPMPYSMSNNKPVVFLNKICLVDDSGYVWTSPDGHAWTKASPAPVCGTKLLFYTAAFQPGMIEPPALFVDGTRIYMQPFESTGSQTILSSSDLVTWDSTSGYQMPYFADYFTEANGGMVFAGYNLNTQPDLEGWFALKNANGVTYSSMSVINVSSLITYKGMALLNDPQNVWMLSQTKTPYWFVCANAPSPAASSLAVFNGTLYFVSATGIYKAIN
jgi:hypothetical protein